MMIFLSKFLPLLVYPAGLCLIFLMLALIFWRKRKLAAGFVTAALLILWIGGNRWVSTAVVRSLEWQYIPDANIPTAEAIVLLSGGTESPQPPRQMVEVNSAGDRVWYAAELYKQGKAAHLLLSGGNIDWLSDAETSPAEDMAAQLKELGVPESALWMEGKSQNTEENAAFSWKELQTRGIKRIILVTSAMHMPRSVMLFKAQGFEVVPAPADYTVTYSSWERLLHPTWQEALINLIPNAGSMNALTNALKEYIGMSVWRIQHP